MKATEKSRKLNSGSNYNEIQLTLLALPGQSSLYFDQRLFLLAAETARQFCDDLTEKRPAPYHENRFYQNATEVYACDMLVAQPCKLYLTMKYI